MVQKWSLIRGGKMVQNGRVQEKSISLFFFLLFYCNYQLLHDWMIFLEEKSRFARGSYAHV